MANFSTQCYRDFKKFIGELTATAAGLHSSVLHTEKYAQSLSAQDPWAEIAESHGVKVNGLVSTQILSSTARLNIVSIYSGFDLFLDAFGKQYFELTGKEWIIKDKDTPFDKFYRNLEIDPKPSYTEVIDYYRLARNAIVHPSLKNIKSAKDFYKKNQSTMDEARKSYSMRTAPNNFDDLSFHDVKLFSRLLFDILPIVDTATDPGNERLKTLLPQEKWTRFKASRRKNAAIGYLKQKYGIPHARAERIYEL